MRVAPRAVPTLSGENKLSHRPRRTSFTGMYPDLYSLSCILELINRPSCFNPLVDVAGVEPALTVLSKHLAYAQNAK